jgi:hypothetical protein
MLNSRQYNREIGESQRRPLRLAPGHYKLQFAREMEILLDDGPFLEDTQPSKMRDRTSFGNGARAVGSWSFASQMAN